MLLTRVNLVALLPQKTIFGFKNTSIKSGHSDAIGCAIFLGVSQNPYVRK